MPNYFEVAILTDEHSFEREREIKFTWRNYKTKQ